MSGSVGDGEWVVLEIGAEPVVLWDGDRWSVAAPGWHFEEIDGPGEIILGDGALLSGTMVDTSDPSTLEHGDLVIAGFTLADLRELVAMERAAGG